MHAPLAGLSAAMWGNATTVVPGMLTGMEAVAGVEWKGWLTVAMLAVGVVLLVSDRVRPDVVMVGLLTVFMAAGVITTRQGLSGFSNPALATVAVLFVVAAGISATGGLEYIMGKVLGQPRGVATGLLRMMAPVLALSAFVNNTPVVVLLLPAVVDFCRKTRLPEKQLLLPLSFSALLGGTITLVGTSSSLVLAGLHHRRYVDPDSNHYDPHASPIAIFDITRFGLPVAVWGVLYIALAAPLLLPGRPGLDSEEQSEILVGLRVQPGSCVVGLSIEAAGLRGLESLYLVAVRRGRETTHAVGPGFVLLEGDVLFFAGLLADVEGLAADKGLVPAAHDEEAMTPGSSGARTSLDGCATDAHVDTTPLLRNGVPTSPRDSASTRQQLHHGPPKLVLASVRPEASIVGRTIKEVHFRKRFSAAIVAVQRAGQNIAGTQLGRVALQGGDTLVLNVRMEAWFGNAEVAACFEQVHASSGEAGGQLEREFMVPMVVRGWLLVGKTIEAAGLRGLPDSFLVAIERGGQLIEAVGPSEVLEEGDVAWFACRADSVKSIRRIPGLLPHTDQVDKLGSSHLDRRLVQAVIAVHSALAGNTIRQLRFRTRFDAAVVAVHRQGQRIHAKVGDIVLAPGDVLLLDTGPHFMAEHKNSALFALISEIEDSTPPRFDKLLIAVGAALAAFVISSAGACDLVVALLLAVGAMLATSCIGREAALAAIRWDVVIMIGAAFGISEALQESGVAAALAGALVRAGEAYGGRAMLVAALYLATALVCQVVATNAAAALMWPIAANVADAQGIDPALMAIVLMLASSCCFMSPFSYQTNLMVYAAGSYRTIDFVRFGAGLQVWHAVVTLTVVSFEGERRLMYAATAIAAACMVVALPLWDAARARWAASAAHARRVQSWHAFDEMM